MQGFLYVCEYYHFDEEEFKQFHVLGQGYFDALEKSVAYLMETVGEQEDGWEITDLHTIPDVDIINARIDDEEESSHCLWESPEDTKIECPVCAISKSVLDKIMKFPCPACGKEFVVSDNGWTALTCTACGVRVPRETISRDDKTGKLVCILPGLENEGKEE